LNRSITLLGVALLVLAIGLLVYPVASTGAEQLDPVADIGLFLIPASLLSIGWGASRVDPESTTVAGVFGSSEANLLRRPRGPPVERDPVRYRPSSRESVNCRKCYTMVPSTVAECPRCGTRRPCRGCDKPLFYLAGGVRCGPCVKDEAFCDCPRVARTTAAWSGARARP
jgi:hypothetical protein